MHLFVTLSLWCALLSNSIASLTKQATVHTANNPTNGIRVLQNSRSVQTTSDEWKVTFVTQQGYDLQVSLNNEWGFDPINPSTLTLTLNGTNYNHAEGDLLLVFSVSNSHYFAVVIRNEISSQLYKVYPQSYSSQLSPSNVQSMIALSTPDRWDRITKNDTWYNTIPLYKNPTSFGTEWPIQLTVVNDPIANTVRYSQNEVRTNSQLYSATFLSAFAPNHGLDLYIMSDGAGESFGIYDIHITYDIEMIHSANPTAAPSITPSIPPTTRTPSISPTISPTTPHPTLEPTLSPTNLPSIAPNTQNPTVRMRSDFPTQSLTPQPSDAPTVDTYTTSLATLHVQRETVQSTNDVDGTNIITTDSHAIDFIVVGSNHNDIAVVTILAACIGSLFCIFTLVLLCCCIKSQSRRHEKTAKPNRRNSIQYHVPQMNQYGVPSSTNIIDPVQEHRMFPIENGTEPTASSTLDSDREEKEGELLTVNGMQVDMSDLMKYDTASVPSNTSKRRLEHSSHHVVHDVNVHSIIDYDKMERYLNDVDLSSSSHETNLDIYVTKTKTGLEAPNESVR